MHVTNSHSLFFLVIWALIPSGALSTCYNFETAGAPQPKAEVCYKGDCKKISMSDFCGGMSDGYSYTGSSFNLPDGQILSKSCQSYDDGTRCDWKIDGVSISPDFWVNASCINKSKEDEGSEANPCNQLNPHPSK